MARIKFPPFEAVFDMSSIHCCEGAFKRVFLLETIGTEIHHDQTVAGLERQGELIAPFLPILDWMYMYMYAATVEILDAEELRA
tara:strand:- start:818 stop:1069 length:252 start_codon:yes stop_codon:yes gene_type:complete